MDDKQRAGLAQLACGEETLVSSAKQEPPQTKLTLVGYIWESPSFKEGWKSKSCTCPVLVAIIRPRQGHRHEGGQYDSTRSI